MKKLILRGMIACFAAMALSTTAVAGELDVLVEKLVDKGILSPVEAQIIIDETKETVAKEVAQGKSYAVPGWVQKVKVKQDLRLRYQYSDKDPSSNPDRNRGRLRYRLGVEGNVADGVKVGAGLATGGSDLRSTNQTFDDVFSTKGINLDYAYAEWQARDNVKVIGGKFKRKPYLWQPSDLLWDGDINPEGVSINHTHDLGAVDYFGNAGYWVLTESGSTSEDPFLMYYQGGVKFSEGDFFGKLAATYYGFENLRGNSFNEDDGSAETNTSITTGLVSDYDAFGVEGEVGVKTDTPLKRVTVFGQYVQNLDDDNITEDAGYAVGVKVGDKKVKKPGQWQLKYIYADLDKDAWFDLLPDSDRLGGSTGVESHELALKYALKKNVILGLDYYHSEAKGSSVEEDVLQADLVFKF